MLPATDDTIAAVASPHGGAARGIVRISGPDTVNLCRQFFTPGAPPDDSPDDWPGPDLSARRHAGTWRIGTAADLSRQLPVDLHLWPNRNSYTGQPSAEIHMIGSPPVLQKLLEELLAHETPGVRVARPGEFTLRSFLAGRIDLVQAEAVLGVIEAEDHVGLEVALRQLAGGLSGPLGQLRSQLVDLLSDLEAGLDFADEDIEFISARQRTDRLEALAQTLATIRQQAGQRMTSGGRHQIVLAGLPNAGKSTLLNALSNHSTAITSPRAGTTRDVVTADITLDGLDVRLVDTAGWEAETQPGQASIDQLARQKRLDQLAPAALAVWCVSSPEPGIQVAAHLANDRQARQEIRQAGTPMLVLHSRCDLAADDQRELTVEADLSVSTVTGQGMAALRDTLVARLGNDTHAGPSVVGSTAARTSEALRRTEARLAAAAAVPDELLVAVEIREALDQLGAVMGTVYTDEILDQVFSKFCIGK